MLLYLEIDTALDVVINRLELLKKIININVKLFKELEIETVRKLGLSEGRLKDYREKT